MRARQAVPRSIPEYIAQYPANVRRRLQAIRRTIRSAVPAATETISYRIPTFVLGKNLIHFAAFTSHIGLYPAPRGSAEFREELAQYKGGKGTVQFPHDRPVPLGLVRRIVKFQVARLAARAAARGRK